MNKGGHVISLKHEWELTTFLIWESKWDCDIYMLFTDFPSHHFPACHWLDKAIFSPHNESTIANRYRFIPKGWLPSTWALAFEFLKPLHHVELERFQCGYTNPKLARCLVFQLSHLVRIFPNMLLFPLNWLRIFCQKNGNVWQLDVAKMFSQRLCGKFIPQSEVKFTTWHVIMEAHETGIKCQAIEHTGSGMVQG